MRADIVEAMAATRRRTLDLVGHLAAADLERQVDPILSPLVWDLAHIAAYEDLWLVHRFAGAPLLRPDLAARYERLRDAAFGARRDRAARHRRRARVPR